MFLDHLRCRWAFKKFYFEVPEFNAFQFQSAISGGLVEEARLREHLFFAGRYWDMSVVALASNEKLTRRGKSATNRDGS